MPIPRNPAEELLLEWVLIEGYLGLTNMRLFSGQKGGVSEADVLGFRLCKENGRSCLKIIHIETGNLADSFEKHVITITKKFSNKNCEAVRILATDYIQTDQEEVDIKYRKIYIATYISKKQLPELSKRLSQDNIEFYKLSDFVIQVIRHSLPKWKKKRKELGLGKGSAFSVPEEYWFMQLIEWLEDSLKIENQSVN